MRAARLSALAALVAGLSALAPSLGQSHSSATTAAQQGCGRVEHASGLEAVFGRRRTHQQAIALRNLVVSRGFVNANIIEDCPTSFKVVVRGIDTFTIGVDLQSEARREGFPVTLECIKGKEIGRWEAVFGHPRDRQAANALVDRGAQQGIPGLRTRPDACGGFEIYLAGFDDRQEAETFAAQARRAGFTVVVERN